MNESRIYDLVIFDWDGTIVDSAAQIVSSMQGAIRDLDLPSRSDQQIAELIGLGLQDAIGRLFPELPTEHVLGMLDGYRRHYGNAIENPAPIFPGMQELLETLQARGSMLAVATGKSRRGLDRALRDSQLGPHFAHTRCADETANKPDPLMLEELLEVTGVNPEAAVMIGDTEYDMAMARQAGVAGFGVAWGVHEEERQLQAGAAQVCATPQALEAALLGKPSKAVG